MSTLGFPPPNTSEAVAFWAAFWPSFWSSAASGVVTGLVAGLVVGLILLRHQKSAEARALTATYGRELSVKLDLLRQALMLQDVVNISSAQSALPLPATRALEHLRDAPLTQWKQYLPAHQHLIGQAIALQKAAAAFASVAAEVDHLLRRRVRAFNHQRNAISANDGVYVKYSVGTILGVDGAQLLPWLASDGPSTLEPYEKAWESIGADAHLTQLGEQLRAARESAMKLAAELLHAIDA